MGHSKHWRIAWSLRIPETDMSIGVVDNCIDDEDEICLVPSDTTTSQVWFMEKYFPICPDKIHAKREVEEGNYFLQSAFNSTVYMEAVSSPWHITAGSEPSTQFKLKYVKERSARFTLTLVTKSVPAPVIADVGGYIGLALKATEFILMEKDEGNPGHIICCADSGHRHKIGHLHKEGHIHKVVSSRVVTDINDNAAFAIDSREAGELEQMWILIPA
ncbi:hypothetical protein APHAL10511_007791 [Amanita phalloides]|nr:hypothetical protein APHAL10511_007791 [Amanita phalloides]